MKQPYFNHNQQILKIMRAILFFFLITFIAFCYLLYFLLDKKTQKNTLMAQILTHIHILYPILRTLDRIVILATKF